MVACTLQHCAQGPLPRWSQSSGVTSAERYCPRWHICSISENTRACHSPFAANSTTICGCSCTCECHLELFRGTFAIQFLLGLSLLALRRAFSFPLMVYFIYGLFMSVSHSRSVKSTFTNVGAFRWCQLFLSNSYILIDYSITLHNETCCSDRTCYVVFFFILV